MDISLTNYMFYFTVWYFRFEHVTYSTQLFISLCIWFCPTLIDLNIRMVVLYTDYSFPLFLFLLFFFSPCSCNWKVMALSGSLFWWGFWLRNFVLFFRRSVSVAVASWNFNFVFLKFSIILHNICNITIPSLLVNWIAYYCWDQTDGSLLLCSLFSFCSSITLSASASNHHGFTI